MILIIKNGKLIGVDCLTEKKKTRKAEASETDKKEPKTEIDHFLVPKHEILSAEEISILLEAMKIKVENLPKISINDPAIQHLNPKLGDVIKITRKSATAGISHYYRLIIESNLLAAEEAETENEQ